MRRRETVKKALQRGDHENATSSFESRETSSLRMIKDVRKPLKGASGRGLGKAGAKRLGRMLIQALQPGEEPKGRGKVSLPKTPIGLLEYHFQTDPNNASETDSPTLPSPQVSRFISQAVSKCKREGGISMAELKQMLVAEGCDVNKNKQVNVVTKRLVNDETLVRTTRSASSRLNNKIKQNTTAHKICKGAEWSQRRGKKTPTPRV
ncbi:uncharacterized protein LOC121641398 [Melanotaenia boesemani]|uniref:uncharacterized protein LOC121641398 n=1 Tax=Melanotaenia boesemani TaxID=1250792 RepID=UPI001C053DFC|nr:uncharacterized protein LOC121641398 [Melanotaenia boesemani]